jgi:nitrous oxidase accessory protein NosD
MHARLPRRLLSLVLAALLTVLSTSTRASAGGVKLDVGREAKFLFHRVNDAVAAAFSADTIIIHEGTYNECVTLTGLVLLTIIGKKGAVLDATGCGTAITIVDGDHVTLKSLTITGATTQGILVQSGATNTLIKKSTIQDNAADPGLAVLQTGITVDGAADTTIDGVTVRGATVQGILVSAASGAVVKKSTIRDGIGAGIRLDLADGADVEKNTLQNLLAPAIWLFHQGGQGSTGGATDSLVMSNKIISSPGGGIAAAGTGNTIAKNKIDPVGAAGIEALSTGGNSTYSGNTILAPTGGAGIPQAAPPTRSRRTR